MGTLGTKIAAVSPRRAEEALGVNFVVPGYKGQPTSHPLLPEIRLARAAAVTALRTAGLEAPTSSASAAGRSLALKQHRGVRGAGSRGRRNALTGVAPKASELRFRTIAEVEASREEAGLPELTEALSAEVTARRFPQLVARLRGEEPIE